MAEWLTLTAAAERLGWRVRKVESRARREGWPRRRANRGPAMEYQVPAEVLAEKADSTAEAAESPADPGMAEPADPGGEAVELRDALTAAVERAARAEGELAAERRRSDELIAELRTRAERAEVELAELRRPLLLRLVEALRRQARDR